MTAPIRDTHRWAERPAGDLVDHIIVTYHEALRRDVPPLVETARKVERVHAGKLFAPLGLADLLAEMWGELQAHMMKEEKVLFPMLRAGMHGAQVFMPVRVMEHEHDEHARHLAQIRALTNDLVIPAHACATWTALYQDLRRFEAELVEHIDLENHVLFPRAGSQ